MRTQLLFIFALLAIPFTKIFATEQLWVGETYQCFLEDYADNSLSWVNIRWSVDNGLYQNYSGTYETTVSFREYKSGTYNVTVNWTQTDMADSFAPFYHKSHTWNFTCKDNPLILTPTSTALSVGETKQLSCNFTYDNKYTQTITYSSSNTSVATVSSSGLIIAKGAGTATITASSASSSTKETCFVTVNSDDIKVSSISLNASSVSLNVGETKQLTATVYPTNAKDKTVTWSSSDTGVATVSSSGLVKAISTGNATITCKANDGSGKLATCAVTVTASLSKLYLSANPSGGVVDSGTKVYLTVKAGVTSISGANIYYTMDGTTPTMNSKEYTSSGIPITSTTTLKAIAYKDGYETSEVLTANYTIDSGVKEAYAVLSNDGKTVTFYYDSQKLSRSGVVEINKDNKDNAYRTATQAIFDTSITKYNPTTTAYMFYKCSNLTSITGIENLNTVNVMDMSYMFHDCEKLMSLNLSGFNTANVTNMRKMFCYCSGLTSLDVRKFNTANVKDMCGMFAGCSALTSLDVSNFNTANVKDMCGMFAGCSALTSLDVSNFNTENVTNMSSMFYNCSALTSLDVSNFNTEKVTDMWAMFSSCSALKSLDVSNFNTTNVTSMGSMFYKCSGLTSLDVSNFNTEKVTSMYDMFYYCSALKSLYVSNFNTANVTDMSEMFSGCSGLTTLDVSNFNTKKVKRMTSMFEKCSGLTSLDLSNFNTANVTDMRSMFYNCCALTSLDVSNFNTEKVTSMYDMFCYCSSLTSLDLSSFNTEKVTDMSTMFFYCSKLKTIYCNNAWKCSSSSSMFFFCTSLVGAISYDVKKTDVTYANPDTGYFTKKAYTIGDANGDGNVTITDAVAIVNKILGNESAGFNKDAADVNGDGEITITDAVGVVNIILNGKASAPALEQEPAAILQDPD